MVQINEDYKNFQVFESLAELNNRIEEFKKETEESNKKLRKIIVTNIVLTVFTALIGFGAGFCGVLAAQFAEDKVDFRYFGMVNTFEQLYNITIHTHYGKVCHSKADWDIEEGKGSSHEKRTFIQKLFKYFSETHTIKKREYVEKR